MFSLKNPVDSFLKWLGVSTTGEPQVSEETMLGCAEIWYAINTIAGDVGKMPLEPRRFSDRLNFVDTSNVYYRLLRDEANRYQTADVFKEQLQAHALSWGNGRAFIVRGPRPELLPLRPDYSWSVMVDGEKWHVTQPESDDPLESFVELRERLPMGDIPRGMYAIPDRDVLHIMGFGYYGIEGRSIATQFKEMIGTALASQRYNKDQLNNGMAARIMLEAPIGAIQDEEEAQAMLKAFRENYSRKNKGEVVGMLREGIKAADVSRMSNIDAQFLEQRKFTRQEIMLVFGLQHIPGDDSSVSYNSLEQKQLAYLASCLSRWLTRWEMQCDMKLRSPVEKRNNNLFFKFNRGTWLQMDAPATADVLTKYRSAKIMTQNECRDKLDLNPVEGGDVFENPNVTTNETNQTVDPDQVSTAVQNTAAYLAAQVLFDKFLETECQQVEKAINSKNIIDWIERKYNTWAKTYERQATKLGVEPELFVEDLLNRKEQLLQACECQPEELRNRVLSVVQEWRTV